MSCFAANNALPSLQYVDDYNYAQGGTAYTTGGYKPTDASGPLIQPSLDGVTFQEKCARCSAAMSALMLTSLSCSGGRTFTAAKIVNAPYPASHVAITAVAQVTNEGLQYFPLQRLSV